MGQQYISINDLYEHFSQIEIDDLAGTDEIKVTSIISSVSALIDGYVAPRYRLPLVNQYEILKDAACDIVFYKLYNIQPPENARKRYEDAMALLERIASGKVMLNEPTGEESKARTKIYVKKNPRKFTMQMWGD
jgi:conserved hypothetical protein|nr:MAG TPA: head to tail adaptor [Caudoviricetes sp.]